jgi:hypothetical protein
MDFEWDERKRLRNIERHSLDFTEAEGMFRGPMLTALDTREAYAEDRWIGRRGVSRARLSGRLHGTRRRPSHQNHLAKKSLVP